MGLTKVRLQVRQESGRPIDACRIFAETGWQCLRSNRRAVRDTRQLHGLLYVLGYSPFLTCESFVSTSLPI